MIADSLRRTCLPLVFALAALVVPCVAAAQTAEIVGTRALGMAGAFTAVADDASAVWWNPAGLATGRLLDFRIDGGDLSALTGRDQPATSATAGHRTGTWFVGITVPSLGLSYLRTRYQDIWPRTTAAASDDRQQDRPAPGLARLGIDQFGLTAVQSVAGGLALASTVKILRGRAGFQPSVPTTGLSGDSLLAQAGDVPTTASTKFDLDVGAMLTVGVMRLGLTVRNLREPTFEAPGGTPGTPEAVTLPRQARAGIAILPGGPTSATILAVDADLTRVTRPQGERRHVAAGAEQWFAAKRVGVRGGVRWSTVGPTGMAGAAGMSVAVRRGMYVEGQLTRGGARAERGWSVGVAATF